MTRLIFFVVLVCYLSSCALFESGNQGLLRSSLQDLSPRVSFVENKEIKVVKSDIESVRIEQVIESYLKLMQSPHSEVRRQATRRLADLNMRLAEAKNLELADGKSMEQIPASIRNASYQEAARLYQQVIDNFPEQADDASIRYQLSRSLAMDGKQEEALSQMDQLVMNHQISPEMVEVQFRRGEAYFLRSEFRKAAEAYQYVIVSGSATEFYDKALYKNGWSLFKLVDYQSALESFFPLLERLKTNQQMADDIKRVMAELIGDTQRAISLSFYHLEGAESVKEYFSAHGEREYEHEIYGHLAKFFLAQERFQDAAATYLTFIDQHPMHESASRFQLQVIKTYIDGGFPSLVLPAKESFLTRFGVKSPYWAQATEVHKAEMRPHILLNLEEISSHYHAQAQKSKKKDDYLLAANWYSHFLELISVESQVAPYHFLMAEALFDAKEYEKAIKEFDLIAFQYKDFNKREQAAYNILLSYQALLDRTDKNNVEQIKNLKERTIDYTLLYAEFFPTSKRVSELVLRAAEELVLFKRLPEAIQTSQKLLALTGPRTKAQSDRAKVIIANGYFDLKDYALAEKAITDVIVEASLTKSELAEFRERRAQSIYKLAEALKEKGDSDGAIQEYQRLVRIEPGSSVRPNAEIDAAILLMKEERWSEAKVALEQFQKIFSSHTLAVGLDERLALVYEKLQMWVNAATAYQRIGAESKDPDKSRDIQWYIAELYVKANRPGLAIESYKKYVWTYALPYFQNIEGQAKLIELYIQTGDSEKRDFWRNKMISSYRAGGANNNDRTRYLAAKASFELADPLFDTFKSINLTLPLQKSLKKKKAAMDKAMKAYGNVGEFKVAEFTTASTHRVGELYQILARDILKSERPKGMNEEELEEYKYLIEDQAFPIEEKAIAIFQSNSDRVLSNIYDEWVKKSFTALSRLQPARYDKPEQLESWFGVSLQ